jgi:hypothetical protein
MYKDDRGGIVIYMGSVHSHEASPLKSAYVRPSMRCWGSRASGQGRREAQRALACGVSGFRAYAAVDKQIPEQAKELGISEEDVIKRVMLGGTVDGIFTTVEDVAQTVLFLSTFPTAALTGQSFIVSHGWYMQ